MVDGGLLSWPCMLPIGHDGPHQAVESPSSVRKRDQWLADQNLIPATEGVVMEPTAGVPKQSAAIPTDTLGRIMRSTMRDEATSVPLEPGAINDFDHRIRAIMAHISGGDLSKLPTPVASWAMGMLAHTGLLALWELAQREFDAGASAVSLSPEFLDRLVPVQLRQYLGRSQS